MVGSSVVVSSVAISSAVWSTFVVEGERLTFGGWCSEERAPMAMSVGLFLLIRTLGDLLCGYGDLAAFLYMLESSPRLYTDDNHKLGGVSRK